MAAIVEFCSVEFVKINTGIQENVDDSKVKPYITKVQDTHIQNSLGSSFTEHLYKGVADGTLTTHEEDLIRNYIQRTVAEWVYYEIYPSMNYKATNKSIAKEGSEYSTPAELSEIKYMRNTIRDMAEFYSARLEKYLDDNASKFPEYQNPDLPENLPRRGGSFFNGIYMPKNKKC